MPDDVPRLPWTDEQWAALQRIVQEAAGKARVASSFLPLVGLAPGQASVPKLVLDDTGKRLAIDDAPTVPLVTAQCLVYLTTQQVEDPELSSAKQLLARAADAVGRLEDAVIFNGDPPGKEVSYLQRFASVRWTAQQVDKRGLVDPNATPKPVIRTKASEEDGAHWVVQGNELVSVVVEAISEIEAHGHYGPFACVLGHELYRAANTPNPDSLVLPSDRIVPFLDGGPLRRSSVLAKELGVIVGLAGAPVDLVVASDVHMKFLQITTDPYYVLRVSERFVLRVKQSEAICNLMAYTPTAAIPKNDQDDQ